MHIEQVSIDTLILDPENEREHPADNLKDIKNSLRLFGQQTPITVHKGNRIILKGNGTVMAAKDLGWDKIWVHWNEFTDKRAKAYKIADNRSAEKAKWNKDLLSTSLKALQDEFPPIDLGFDENWIKTEPVAGLTDDDEVPDQVDTRCQPGDLWLLGEHRLLCGDSTNVKHIERLIDGEKANMVFTDPPYLQDAVGGGYIGKKAIGHDLVRNNLNSFDPEKLFSILSILDLDSIYCFGSKKLILPYLQYFTQTERLWDLLVMSKKNPIPSKSNNWLPDIEWLFFSRKKGAYFDDKQEFESYFRVRQIAVKPRELGHPTEKQVAYIEPYLKISSPNKGIVLDLFLGSGTTLIACEKTGRKCFGMEIDPHYCDVIITRWESFSGKSAVRHINEVNSPWLG